VLAAPRGTDLAEKVAALEGLLQERDAAIGRASTLATINTVLQASEESYFRAVLNGVDVLLPRDTIRTMLQCVHGRQEGPLRIDIEDCHRRWMMSHMVEGGTFLDVGSATGAITIPMAAALGSKARIVAFEPARKARRLLEATLARNGLDSVEIVPKAISNFVGRATFCEYGFDESGTCPFLPEASSIQSIVIDDARVTKFEVEVTTLNAYYSARGDLGGPVVIKIDVEGFEVLVLEGASSLITSTRPWLSIDIHRDPFGEGTTEAKVRDFLAAFGYRFENLGHVLVASP
jgi:FkbM family methyltransferase